jgi:glycine betaine/choline ABC-type transport system substrate-binding protein
MIAANATDGLLAKLDVKVLDDDKNAFPPYEAVVLVRAPAFEQYPGLRDGLKQLSGAISDDMMRDFNFQVDVQHRPLSEVAGALLGRLQAR